jgi:hypothetical protein
MHCQVWDWVGDALDSVVARFQQKSPHVSESATFLQFSPLAVS